MKPAAAGGRTFALCAGLVAAGALLANELVLARFSSDGTLEPATRVLIRIAQLCVLALALGLFLGRRRLEHLFEREPRALRAVLVAGIALRVALFPFLGPDNNDPHRDVIAFVVEHGWTPAADQATLGFQPPLYYLMAAPWALAGFAKLTQLLSLLLSIANLVLLHRWVRETALLRDPRARVHAFLLLAFLPQFVLFGLFVSNDALAFPLGTLLFTQWMLYAERPSLKRLVGVGVGLGLGLLTKGTFIGFLPPAFVLVLAVELHGRQPLRALAGRLLLLGLVTVAAGSYKFIENQRRFGSPVIDNEILGQAWVQKQQGTVRGLSSFVDFDLPRLIRYPYAGEETRHSLPLLFYGTFWYSHIQESNLNLTRRHPFTLVPRVVYAAGALTTLLVAVGLFACLARNARPWRSLRAEGVVFRQRVLETALTVTLLLELWLVLSWGLKHDAWSFFQSRLVFPAILPLALWLGWGFEALAARFPRLAALANVALLAPWIASLAWLGIELVGQAAS